MAQRCIEIPEYVYIEGIVDPHGHLRNLLRDNDGRMEMNMRYCVSYLAILVSIGNGVIAVTDQASANQHIDDAYSCMASGANTVVYAAPLMTDTTTPEMMRATRRREPRNVPFWKIFLEGVSNDAGRNVSDVSKIHNTIRASYDSSVKASRMPIAIHAERKLTREGERIEMRDREWYAVDHDVRDLLETHPRMVLIIKHVSDWRTMDFIREYRARGFAVFGGICAHYMFKCHEDLYEGVGGKGTAFNANLLCWPLYKDAKSMEALREAALSGDEGVFYESDWACHVDDPTWKDGSDRTRKGGVKITDDGMVCGGVAIIPAVGISLVIDLFVEAGKIEHLNAFLSRNARKVHGWPQATQTVRFNREDWIVEPVLKGEGPDGPIEVLPFMRGETCHWKLAA